MSYSSHRISLNKIVTPILKNYSKKKSLEIGSGINQKSYSKKYMQNSITLDIIDGVDVKASVYKMPFKANFFEFVFCIESFYSFEQPRKALKEISRVLKKNGVFVFSSEFVFPKLCDTSLFGLYSDDALNNFLLDAGFKNIKLIPVSGFFGALGNLIERKIMSFGKLRYVFYPILIGVWFLYFIDIKKDSNFTTAFVVVAQK